LGFCYWAGKPATVDVFNTGQQFGTHARSEDELIGMIAAHRFAALQFDTLSPFELGNRVRAAILRAYRLHHQDDDGYFLVPR
jgi:hypothetical protein